jgi:uncharacterized protein YrrD
VSERARPIAWTVLAKGMSIYASDGEELGKVADVVADLQRDIFSGLLLREGLLDSPRFVPADLIGEITTEGVTLSIRSADAKQRLERPET